MISVRRNTLNQVAVFLLGGLALACGRSSSDITVAVASNFYPTMAKVVEQFQLDTSHRITLIAGSSGTHYAQIRNGAPIDIFFSADTLRPALLEREGLAVPATRFTYAVGRLALWSWNPDLVQPGGSVLRGNKFNRLSIANPDLAPYGVAAREVLKAMQVWEEKRDRIVRGENVGQAFHFVRSESAALGFVAYSQIRQLDESARGSFWIIPDSLYDPIEQQAVLLEDTPISRAFLEYIQGDSVRSWIISDGYRLP